MILAIVELIQKKNLQINLHKVKGHSGNIGNEMADQLAKTSTFERKRDNVTTNVQQLNTTTIIYQWDNKPTDIPINILTKSIAKNKWASK